MTAAATFGARLRQLREAAGLTQKQLAEKLGIAQQHVARYESEADPTEPVWSRVCALADALGVPVAAFRPDASEAGEGKSRL